MLSIDFFGISVPTESLTSRVKHSNFYRLVTAYREHGHKQANIDPISLRVLYPPFEINLDKFGLSLNDKVSFDGILNVKQKDGTVREALDILENFYSNTIGAEFCYLEVNLS